VSHSLTGKLIGFLLLCPLLVNSALSKDIENNSLGKQLEEVLNKGKSDLLEELFIKESFNKFKKKYLSFKKKYRDIKWSIKTISKYSNKSLLDIKITSKREIGDQIYNLQSKQTVKIETQKNKIIGYKVIEEESILNSQNSPLIVRIVSPEKVLTGERYEINLIIERPLDKLLTAGGMIIINNKDHINISNNPFDIKPNQSGGLFKYIQAPLDAGSQTFSAIITHPEGIYSITKKIKVGL